MTAVATSGARPALTQRRSGPRIASRTPDGWVDRPYSRFALDPVSPTIGAEVSGVSLAEPVDDELFEELNRALLEWKVLFFRGQQITAAEQMAFAKSWGPIESHPFVRLRDDNQPEDTPEVLRLQKGKPTGPDPLQALRSPPRERPRARASGDGFELDDDTVVVGRAAAFPTRSVDPRASRWWPGDSARSWHRRTGPGRPRPTCTSTTSRPSAVEGPELRSPSRRRHRRRDRPGGHRA